jgi:hypothetical protein
VAPGAAPRTGAAAAARVTAVGAARAAGRSAAATATISATILTSQVITEFTHPIIQRRDSGNHHVRLLARIAGRTAVASSSISVVPVVVPSHRYLISEATTVNHGTKNKHIYTAPYPIPTLAWTLRRARRGIAHNNWS